MEFIAAEIPSVARACRKHYLACQVRGGGDTIHCCVQYHGSESIAYNGIERLRVLEDCVGVRYEGMPTCSVLGGTEASSPLLLSCVLSSSL